MRSSDLPVSAYLPLRYVLTDTVAVRTRRDPLQVATDLTVPGRAQRGMLAAVLRHAGREGALHDWVARGRQVCFATAHPRLEPGCVEDGTPHPDPATVRVACPAPANLYTPGKDGTTLVDVFGPTDPSVPYKAVREPLTPDRVLRARVRTTTERFLSRPGRHTPGGPFHTTALDADQVFEARWHLRAPHTRALQNLAHDILDTLDRAGGSLTLGSGGTRAHGGVRVGPADPDRPLSPDRVRLPWTERSVPPGGTLDLLLLAPALVVGAHGGASPRSLVAEVADLCGRVLPGAGIEVGTAHVEPVLVGAYHRGYHGPMAQRWAAAPGAVVRLFTRAGLSTEQVRELETHQVGERAVEGYGQFTLLPPPPETPVPLPPRAEPVAARTSSAPSGAHTAVPAASPAPGRAGGGPASAPRLPRADGHDPSPGRPGQDGTDPPGAEYWGGPPGRLQDALLWDAARPVVRAHARARARACEHRLPPLTPGLLDRLRAVLTRPDRTPHGCLADLARAVAGGDGVLSAKAVRALEHARPTGAERPAPVTARAWLTLPGDPGAVAAWWTDHRPASGADPDYAAALAAVDLDLADGRPPAPGELSPRAREWERRAAARLARAHLVAWMTEAARLLRARGGVHS
ncbi:hypothetical protein [Nocardiopsis kunsanensis]|uniref:hypothetical protein n=1 Tax=Nocardiopsis kunsanensis TaxID=141693 RepID=UPI0003491C89|nr:hypothetical protein [Nocardiopsis kunsanensis]